MNNSKISLEAFKAKAQALSTEALSKITGGSGTVVLNNCHSSGTCTNGSCN